MSRLTEKAQEELDKVEELLEAEFCDDGLVFYHLTNAVLFLLKELASEYNLSPDTESISELIETIEKRTTVRFPQWIDEILELEEISVSDGCSTSICYDMDMYGDVLEAVYQLKEFVLSQVEG